jgi:hypothetical protein
MIWAPDEQTRGAVKFWLDCLQVLTVIGGVITASVTIVGYVNEQQARAIEQEERAEAQEQRAKDQLAAAKRELQRPYEEKKLDLYLDAARVLAHLATSPGVDTERTETRFWELYWGELAFVESTAADEDTGGPRPSVERLMVAFCQQYFGDERCSDQAGAAGAAPPKTARQGKRQAIEMARQASKEIRDRWERLGR